MVICFSATPHTFSSVCVFYPSLLVLRPKYSLVNLFSHIVEGILHHISFYYATLFTDGLTSTPFILSHFLSHLLIYLSHTYDGTEVCNLTGCRLTLSPLISVSLSLFTSVYLSVSAIVRLQGFLHKI